PSQNFHVERRHDGCKNGGHCCKRDRQRNVSLCQVRHYIRCQTTRTTANENQSCGYLRPQRKYICKPPTQERHDGKLTKHTDNCPFWHFDHARKIPKAQRCSHAEHNDLEERGDEPLQFKISDPNEVLRKIHRQRHRGEDYHGIGISLQQRVSPETDGYQDEE